MCSEKDPHPLAVTESMAAGNAVIASDRVGCVGPTDAARPGVNALAGVSCEICHKIFDADPLSNATGFITGTVTITRPVPAGPSTIMAQYGLLGDVSYIISDVMNPSLNPDVGVLMITHYKRILNYIKPDYVHVMYDGALVRSGGKELALELEEKGYDWLREAGAA